MTGSKWTFLKKIGPWFLIIPSAIIGILIVEVLCRLFLPSIGNARNLDKGIHRVIFFDGTDTVFQNHGDIFTFVAHDQIRVLTGFFSEDAFSVEYDYRFRTNNLGLVQDDDIMPERESLLLLGDSFTQGLGAEPWFRRVSPEITNLGYQAINGGLMGTGFEQWVKLERYLAAQNVRIRKVIVPFISLDYPRLVRNITQPTLQCLSALAICRVEESYLYRLPQREEFDAWITKIRTARTARLWLEARAGALLPASYHVYRYFRERLQDPSSIGSTGRAEQQSRAAIAELIQAHGAENVAFIHLPQKDEVDGPMRFGLKARASIREAGGKLFDGFKLCRLTPLDYYVADDHPNVDGYAKIGACISNIIREVMTGTQ